MNLEAISGIKRTSRACAHLREECLKLINPGIRLSFINNKAAEIISSLNATSKTYETDGKWHIKFDTKTQELDTPAIDRELKSSDTITISVSLNIDNWQANCSATKHLEDSTEIDDLIQENKNAVIETCNSLCPGLQTSDIEAALKLSHDNKLIPQTQSFYSELDTKLQIRQRLKTGDLLSIHCRSARHTDPARCALHEETVLITANGTEILTRP